MPPNNPDVNITDLVREDLDLISICSGVNESENGVPILRVANK